MDPLATQLYTVLQGLHAGWGVDIPPEPIPGAVYYAVGGGSGVVMFDEEYMLAGWLPGPHAATCARDTVGLIRDKLAELGIVRVQVYWRNYRCIKAVRKLGAEPLGVDDDQFFHYLLTRDGFRFNQLHTGH